MKKLTYTNKFRALTMAVTLCVSLTACKKDAPLNDDNPPAQISGKGAYIINEGSFGAGNASVSYYSTSDDKMNNDVFFAANNRPMGDVAQSITIHNNKVYIVVNASNKLEVVSITDFKSVAIVSGLVNPRYFAGAGLSKGYISQWNGKISVLDISTNTIMKNITVGSSPERMLVYNSKLYVTNSNGYGKDSIISVINTVSDEVVKDIVVGEDPKAIVKDKNNKLWVLCGGTVVYDNNPPYAIISQTTSKLVRINPASDLVESSIEISDTLHPSNLCISPDGNTLYYGGGYGFNGIYKMLISENAAPIAPFINEVFYGFGVNDTNGEIYGCIASGGNNGSLKRYKPDGTFIKEYKVGVYPNGAAFNMN